MVKQLQQYCGTLSRMPFPDMPSIAEAQMLPLTTDNDFSVFANFTSSPYPVFVNVREHYQILSDLVDEAQLCWPKITIIVRISMPGGMRIPANLLADNVLLLEDITCEEQKLVVFENSLLVIEDYFTRIEIDNNDNSVRLRLYSNDVLPSGALQPLITCLQKRGVI
ncbi:hypothetical protein [Colwellia psychrerythraea]|uniref:Uncharacterized protein n=1 Tax=Colwellia psychrerythraea TaxID=28229 RepID=A0A099KVL2_COLPS|nr:hypothetical protein [Colwellia psychrerythraea]KGJ93907.1 hypothetical protein GAB14E_2462 [Colwellia psychrerythraea]